MGAIHGCESGKMTRKARIDSVTPGRSGGARNARAPDRAAVAHWLDQHAAATGDRRYRHAASILRAPPAGRPTCADDVAIMDVRLMMRDRETPEADMMRDQSSVDAAPGLFGPKGRTRVSIPITPARPLTPRWTTWPGGRSRRPGAALVPPFRSSDRRPGRRTRNRPSGSCSGG